MSAWIIGILLSTAMVAALVGIGSAALFDLNADQIDAGQAETDRGIVLESTLDEVQETSAAGKILEFIPANIFLDMTGERSTSVIARSEEHTSELQSRGHLVCRLLLEKKKRSETSS